MGGERGGERLDFSFYAAGGVKSVRRAEGGKPFVIARSIDPDESDVAISKFKSFLTAEDAKLRKVKPNIRVIERLL